MKNIALAAAFVTFSFAAHANTEAACKKAHEDAVKAGHAEIANMMAEQLKEGNYEACVKLAPAV